MQQGKSSIKVNVTSECGRLNAVLLHRPGVEIELMTPENASQALYSDILNKRIVDQEYGNFCGVFERWTKVYYVTDLLRQLLDDSEVREKLVRESCAIDDCDCLAFELLQLDNDTLARILIEGYEYRKGFYPEQFSGERFILKPLYNLFFTRDASSSMYDRVLINSMSFQVRRRETLIFKTIFEHYFGCETLNAQQWRPDARTEGGDVQIARNDLLCIGQGIRTNTKGIDYLAQTFAKERPKFHIIAQQLPMQPESFIHLDMVFTFLSTHQCMMYEPMLRKTGNFADKSTTLITIDNGNIRYEQKDNILQALKEVGMDLEPVFCGGDDAWTQQREQWHSGANFFALDEGRIIGYERNSHTIDALDHAGFSVLAAEDVCSGKVDINDYAKCVVTFKAGELPRAGGGARCMTMPINRNEVTGK
ncbi:MAG: arginine deiminase [Bacteroidales bacterium]|nr:arginine deiminase [Bacteroidales bacterium]